jgi:hypothetical protein
MIKTTIGIIGGCGQVGQKAVRYLIDETSHNILLGGRNTPDDSMKKQAQGRSSFMPVDIFQDKSLSAFCDECDILINCAGPSAMAGDRVAMAALKHNIHYVDPGGHNPVYHSLTAHNKEMKKKGLISVLAVGILPGLSELFPIHEANRNFDTILNMEYSYIGRDRWTHNSAYDIAWGVGNIGKGEAAIIYEQGKLKKVNLFTSGKTVQLPPPLGKRKLFPVFREELRDFVESHNIKNARVYGNNWGVWVSLATIAVRLLHWHGTKRQLHQSADLIVKAAKRDLKDKSPGFMLHLTMQGTKNGQPMSLASTLYFEDTYRATGICAAIAARMIAEGNIPAGRHWASQIPNTEAFINLFQQQNYTIIRKQDPDSTSPVKKAAI